MPGLSHLCVAPPGCESFWVDAKPDAGDVRVPGDLALLRGLVVDPDGHPVPGLALRLTDAWLSDQYVPVDVAARTSDAGRAIDEARFVAARTDADGRFEVRVRSSLGLHAISASPGWFLRRDSIDPHAAGFPAGLTSVTLVVLPAVNLEASVLDGRSGERITRFEGHAHDADGSMFVAFEGAAGALAIAWPRWWKADERRTIEVDVEARGYAPARAVVVYEAGASRARTDVRLTPATPDARADVTFDIRDAAGKAFDRGWVVRIVDPRDADKTVMTFDVARVGEGRYRVSMPEGGWTVLVKTDEGLGFLRRMLAVEVRAGAEQTIRCDMPPHGSLRIAWPVDVAPHAAGGSTDPMLTIKRPSERSGSAVRLAVGATSYDAPALPEGDFEIAIYPAGPLSTALRKSARIVAGTVTAIELGKP